jgi:hypothetical protein
MVRVAIAGMLLALSSCSSDAPTDAATQVSSSAMQSVTSGAEAGWSSYTDPSGAFAVSFPDGWTATDHSDDETAAVVFDPPGGGLGTMGVSVIPLPVIFQNFSTAKEWITQLGRSGGPILESGPNDVLGSPGYRTVVRHIPAEGQAWLIESIGTIGGASAILVFVNRDPHDQAAVERFDRLVASLRVKASGSVVSPGTLG